MNAPLRERDVVESVYRSGARFTMVLRHMPTHLNVSRTGIWPLITQRQMRGLLLDDLRRLLGDDRLPVSGTEETT